jgi:hypothetical protein
LAALNGFRPKFRQIAQTLTDVDLVFVEEAMERWMLEYDRAFACKPHSFLFAFMLFGRGRQGLQLTASHPHTLVHLAEDW